MLPQDEDFMRLALSQAEIAGQYDEVPVGAIVVMDNRVIGEGRNQTISASDPTAHAEIVALRHAAKTVSNYRLSGSTLYVTLEPCVMCAGAILQARVARVVFGAHDEKAGAVGSIANLLENPLANHQCRVVSGVLGSESAKLLSDFFRRRRSEV